MAGRENEQLVPPGFRFHPTDEELLYYYLRKKISYEAVDLDVIREVDLNKLEPWDLKDKCRIGSGIENEWYFFSHKDKKYPTGTRTNRATTAGFWKATGRDKAIYMSGNSNSKKIGMRKTLVFYTGRAPHGQKTDWIMHEYRLDDHFDEINNNKTSHHVQEDGWVVCRVFRKKLCHSNEDNIRSGFQPDYQAVVAFQEEEEGAERGRRHFASNSPYIKLPSCAPLVDPRLQNLLLHESPHGCMHLPQLWSPESLTTVPTTSSTSINTCFLSSPFMVSNVADHFQHNLLSLPLTTSNSETERNCGGGIIQRQNDQQRVPGGGGDWSFLDKLLQASQVQNIHNNDHITNSFNYQKSTLGIDMVSSSSPPTQRSYNIL